MDKVNLEQWRWSLFLDLTIKSLEDFQPLPYYIPADFLEKEALVGSNDKGFYAKTITWGCKTKYLKKVRAACVQASPCASVLNLLMMPNEDIDLPFFGVDLVTLPSAHLLALDLQPILKNDNEHTKKVWEKLIPIHDKWQHLLPKGSEIPQEARKFFSPGFLWTKIPIGSEADQLIQNIIYPAYKEYLSLYIELLREATKVSKERSKMFSQGYQSYMSYRSTKDPARNMLTRFYGKDWTEAYIHDVLFSV
tara:strand:+ start:641 stop:1390 length:750 start_codon:yes stop_codon:yes gene_type:complete